MSEHATAISTKAERSGWIGAGLALVAAGLFGAYAGREGPNLAYLIGYCLPGTGVIWVAAWFSAVKPSMVLKGPVLFAIIYVAALSAGLLAGLVAGQQANTALAGMAEARREMISGDKRIDPRPKAGGEAGRMEAFMRERMIEAAEDSANYRRDLAETGLNAAFVPDHLAKPDGLEKLQSSLSRAQAVVARYKALSHSRPLQTRQAAEGLGLSPNLRSNFLSGIDQTQAKQAPLVAESWQLEEDALEAYRSVLAVLERRRWSVSSGRIMFSDATDLAEFNRLMDRATNTTSQQTELARRLESLAPTLP